MEEIRTWWLLLRPKTRAMVRPGKSKESLHPVRVFFFIALGLSFGAGIYAGSSWFLAQVLDVELVGPLIPRKLMSMVFLILISILMISATINSFSVLYLSDDLQLLFGTPVPTGPLFYARFTEMMVSASWMVLFFGLPIFLAYGNVYHAPASFYVVLVLLFPGLIVIPCSIAAMISTVLTCVFSARRSRDLMIILVMLGFVVLYLAIRAMRPEQLLEQDNFGTMMEFMDMFRATESSWLPTVWMTDTLFPLLDNKRVSWLPGLSLWATALCLLTVSGWVCTSLFRYGFARAQEGRVRTQRKSRNGRADDRVPRKTSRFLGDWMDRWAARKQGLTRPLLVKDLRTFFRDTSQWLQLVLLGALAVVYLLNFVYLRMTNFNWFTLYVVNHVLLGLVLSGIGVRFVFPAVSLEGRAWWVVRTGAVRLQGFMHSKLLIYLVPMSLMGVLLSLVSCYVIGVPLAFSVLSIGIVLAMTLGVCTIGVGVGAIYPKFTAENPAKIPTGMGGVTYMITSMIYVMVLLLATGYPLFLLYELPRRREIWLPKPAWFFTSLVLALVLVLVAAWLPMWAGRRKLEAREE